ncbi:c-type cytochrome [Ramlibacter algicola]|uniref:C-type cytochrome n=1 Tax=Ramlibacter algicola TaxID=2795217 RepID=A0A934UQE3_9BURK|nr:c-type cytochrome [Ramlibacter algicola]MBK0392544.1 c-type cytochrome [Ramlibacter algicola]
MSRWAEALLAVALAACTAPSFAQQAYAGIGRDATAAEVKAWDIDVRPDFQGLPKGSGSVEKGQQVWEDKCASCHGVFGESNSVFNPLVGGTSKDDIASGRVAALKRTDFPGRTTMMKVATVSTLWDYINRAMPWNAPKSLGVDEVYAVTAYLLNLSDVVPADFTLSDANIAQVQQRMPNRNGMTTAHAMWPGKGLAGAARPDVQGTRCMKDCAVDPKVTSLLPAFARNAHGNLAEQNRTVGAQRGVDTSGTAAAAPAKPTAEAAVAPPAVAGLLQKNNCTACHASNQRVLGPAWAEVAAKYPGKADYLAGKIKSGGAGVWGPTPMPPQALDDASLRQIAGWLAGAKP